MESERDRTLSGLRTPSANRHNRSAKDNFFYELFEFLFAKIDSIISDYPSSEIIVIGDFNVHNKEWRGSTGTDQQGRAAEIFAVSNDLTNIIHENTLFPRDINVSLARLDLFLTTNPDPYKKIDAPLGRSDHALITVLSTIPEEITETMPRRRMRHYNSVDLDVKLGMEIFNPNSIPQNLNSNHKPWFSKACGQSRQNH